MAPQDELTYLSLDSIKPYANNPRDNDASVPFVAKSMEDFGYNSKIEITEDHVILVGHTRLKALKLLQSQGKLGKGKLVGVTEDHVPVVIKHSLKTKAEQKAYRLSDNKASENSGWAFEKLDIEIVEIQMLDPKINMEDYGFQIDKIEDIPIEDVSEEKSEPVTKTVQIEDPVETEEKQYYVLSVFFDSAENADELLNELRSRGYNVKLN